MRLVFLASSLESPIAVLEPITLPSMAVSLRALAWSTIHITVKAVDLQICKLWQWLGKWSTLDIRHADRLLDGLVFRAVAALDMLRGSSYIIHPNWEAAL